MPRKNININSIYNSWTILESTENMSKHDGPYWLCQCLCGTVKEVAQRALMRGKSRCCGCQTKRPHKLPNEIALFNELKRKYKANAKANRRNFEVNLTDDEFKNLLFNNCHYCGAEPSNKIVHPWTDGFLLYTGIDRVDNAKSYTSDNCVPCCKICNIMKNNLPLEVFLNHIHTIAKKHPRRG